MRKVVNLIPFTIAGWAICGLIMKYSLELFSYTAAITLHATLGPISFVLVMLWYYRLNEKLPPFQAALINGAFVFILDVVVVAMALGEGFGMFYSFAGFWLPLLLIILLTWATGHFIKKGEAETVPPVPANLAP